MHELLKREEEEMNKLNQQQKQEKAAESRKAKTLSMKAPSFFSKKKASAKPIKIEKNEEEKEEE